MTASELMEKYCLENDIPEIRTEEETKELMIDFAKYHVEEAIKNIINNTGGITDENLEQQNIILNAYPIENIK